VKKRPIIIRSAPSISTTIQYSAGELGPWNGGCRQALCTRRAALSIVSGALSEASVEVCM